MVGEAASERLAWVVAEARLSRREAEYLLLEQDGWSRQHIAAHYDVCVGTVEATFSRIRAKLRVRQAVHQVGVELEL